MSDLPYIQQSQEVKITGQDSTGDQVNYVGADANGNLLVKDYSDGPVTPGAVAATSTLVGAQYNSTPPTLTTTQQACLQLTSAGALIVSSTGSTFTGTLTNNNAAPAANNVGVLPAIAKSALNASLYTTGDQVLLVTDLAGNTNVDLQYYLGAAVSKANPIATTISDGTNVITAAISAYGTPPTGTEVMGVNAYITNIPTVNQGTSPWIVKDQSDGPVAPGTVASFSQLSGGQYNSTLPTLTNTQQAALQLDVNGRLISNVVGNVASGSTDSGNGVKVSGLFSGAFSLPTNINAGDRADLQTDTKGRIIKSPDAGKATFSGLWQFTPASSPTDIFTIYGSATTVVTITKLGFSATATTSVITPVILTKRTTANTGGTFGALIDPARHDSNSAMGTAATNYYSANPTGLGTSPGIVRGRRTLIPTTTSLVDSHIEWSFNDNAAQGLVLNLTTEGYCVNMGGILIPGLIVSIYIEWTEE
jgi:hypothetical protein